MNPFLRWVGGKRWLAPTLGPLIVTAISPSGRYIEPFLGAGALALALAEPNKLVRQTFLLNDFCEPLMRTWEWIVKAPDSVDRELRGLVSRHGSDATGYGAVRTAYNMTRSYMVRAAQFLYLNATSFNGVYRENQRGLYNVPHGRTTQAFMTHETMQKVASLLRTRARFSIGDFEPIIDQARFGDVLYADPPYDGVYNDYTAHGFSSEAQSRLAHALKRAVHRGAKVFTSNADTPLIRALYKDWAKIETVSEPRAVAARATARVRTECLLITGLPGEPS
jgi:DNA adenine methylase